MIVYFYKVAIIIFLKKIWVYYLIFFVFFWGGELPPYLAAARKIKHFLHNNILHLAMNSSKEEHHMQTHEGEH